MNLRKFFLIISTMVSVFLFAAGAFIVSFTGLIPSSPANTDNILGDILKPLFSDREPVNILIMGGDKVAKNTDTMMLVNFNPINAKVNILSIPRDTKVQVKGSGVSKVNSAYPIGGHELAVETVTRLLNVKIKYYIYIDTAVFRKIIDLLGGVDFNVPVNMDYDDPTQDLHIHLKKGQQHLNGSQAEQFMRFRQPTHYTNEIKQYYDGSDLKRIEAQQNFIREVIKQKASLYYLPKINSIINEIYKNIDTDISLNEALKMAGNIGKLDKDEINMLKLPGTDSNEASGWYFIHDKAKTDEIIKNYFSSGSSLSTTKKSVTTDGTIYYSRTGNNSQSKEHQSKGCSNAGTADNNKSGTPQQKPVNSDNTAKDNTNYIP